MTYIRPTEPLAEMPADPFYEAVASWEADVSSLSRFLAAERDKSAARISPCRCGHIRLFCACPTLAEER